MPVKSETRRNKRRRERRAEAKAPKPFIRTISKGSVFYRRTLPKCPDMSKAELRAMLAQAAANTGNAV